MRLFLELYSAPESAYHVLKLQVKFAKSSNGYEIANTKTAELTVCISLSILLTPATVETVSEFDVYCIMLPICKDGAEICKDT